MIKTLELKNWFFALLVSFLVAGLFGCSSSEDKAQTKYAEGYRVEQSGKRGEAEQLYRQLLVEFPGTPGAEQAQTRLQLFRQEREQAAAPAAFESLDSVQRVVTGFQSIFHRWPMAVSDFDDKEFIFDSDYMAESVGEGFIVYLALTGEEDRFRLWSFPEQSEFAFRLADTGRTVVGVDRNKTQAEIDATYKVESQKGGLVFLVPR